MPFFDRQLTGNERRSDHVAILDDFHAIFFAGVRQRVETKASIINKSTLVSF